MCFSAFQAGWKRIRGTGGWDRKKFEKNKQLNLGSRRLNTRIYLKRMAVSSTPFLLKISSFDPFSIAKETLIAFIYLSFGERYNKDKVSI